ncbi:enoyl-CoA hydratase/isomerase family protein [Nocardioides carbamazepini]|uniref:enoyl-CoA hydratase/isomerase family protein n=1 Tax=Nocardioides carbamazepini TaxID=2854259 RepID=UPI00214A6162|nr:enoyl-CoA hydratase/isomerase family protein [Nocardioides carbamazepini]MCR1783693.1 enoyl-CoA hydratase/isomerase family protein [Nocardioides carbamazepini]
MSAFGPFRLEVADRVAVATLDRPPVNAFDVAAYQGLTDLVDHVDGREDISVLVLAADESARCWCGGADLRDFRGMDAPRRKERYEVVNAAIPRLQSLRAPVVAAIGGHAIGIGVLLAAACDLRVASVDAGFACPEVDFGLIAGSSRLLNYLGVPEAQIREMTYTGRRLPAAALLASGFLNAAVPRDQVLPRALALAAEIAAKSRAVLRARKQAFVEHETMGWLDAYRLAQGLSGQLVTLPEARAGVERALGTGG